MRSSLNSRPFLVACILLIIVALWLFVYYSQSSGTILKGEQTISTLNGQLVAANSELSTVRDQLSAAKSQVTGLQEQLSAAQAKLNDADSIIKLTKSSVKANQLTLNQGPQSKSSLVTFTADYAGYLQIVTTSTAMTGYIIVTDSFIGYPYNTYEYPVSTGGTLLVPVLPGTVTVYFGNASQGLGATVTTTITYYY